MADGLFDFLGGFGTTPPSYMEGLLGSQATESLRKRSIGSGLVNALIGYAAAPKNQNLGLGRILASAAQAGMQGARGVYDQAGQDLVMQQRLVDMQRKNEQEKALQGYLAGIADPKERLLAQLAPEKFVESRVRTPDSPFAKIDPKDYTPESIAEYRQTNDVASLRALPKATDKPTPTTLEKLISTRDALMASDPNNPNIALYNQAISKEITPSAGVNISYGAPVAGTDAQGNPVFFQPAKGGGAPQIVQGIAPPVTDKPATESQAKANAFVSQMQSASNEIKRLESEGFNPASKKTQVDVALAGTGLTGFAKPLSQQANQAQQQWSEAFLRFKTGAAATEGEVKINRQTFFPQIGDSKEVVEQKARMRKQAENDVAMAGKQPKSGGVNRTKDFILKQYGL